MQNGFVETLLGAAVVAVAAFFFYYGWSSTGAGTVSGYEVVARFDKIEALRPDLVLAFSDLQAELAAELVRRGIAVVTFNQRSVAEILQMIRMLGGLVG